MPRHTRDNLPKPSRRKPLRVSSYYDRDLSFRSAAGFGGRRIRERTPHRGARPSLSSVGGQRGPQRVHASSPSAISARPSSLRRDRRPPGRVDHLSPPARPLTCKGVPVTKEPQFLNIFFDRRTSSWRACFAGVSTVVTAPLALLFFVTAYMQFRFRTPEFSVPSSRPVGRTSRAHQPSLTFDLGETS